MSLEEMSKVFQGKVRTCNGIRVYFELNPNAVSKYSHPYSIPIALEQVTKNEINMMCEQGILKEVHKETEWDAPTFAVPKKIKGVQIVSDFCALN